MVGQPMDLAFELTTDEVGTNQWYTPISIKKILTNSPTDYVVKSVGDWGSGKQLLQYCTNLVVSNWVDLATNTLPLPPPYTNTWNANSMPNSNAFFRVLQRR